MCINLSFTEEISLPQIIDSKMHTKTACSSRVVVQYASFFVLFFKKYFFNFYQMKALEIKLFCKFIGKCCALKDFKLHFKHLNALENKEFQKFELKKTDIFLNFVKFPYFSWHFSKTLIFLTFVYFFRFSWLFLIFWQPC